jgi:hypothetical protein
MSTWTNVAGVVRRWLGSVALAAVAAGAGIASAQCPEAAPGFIGPACVPTGSIVIRKTTVGASATFGFTATPAPPLANFSLAGGGTRTFSGLALGTYVVAETVPAGWALTGLACTVTPPTGGSATPSLAGASVSVTLGADLVQVDCTFTDTKLGSITIVKDATPANGTSFPFNGTGSGVSPTFALAPPGTTQQAFTNLAPGNYSVAELVPAGWRLTNLACTITNAGSNASTFAYNGAPSGDTAAFQPGDTTAAIALAAGDAVVCTYANTAIVEVRVPTLSGMALVALGLLLVGAGAMRLRRR